MNNVIGGEFEIDHRFTRGIKKDLPAAFNKGYFYSSGRAAIFHILNFSVSTGKQKILLPDYLCDSIVDAVKLTSIPFEFYSINSDLSINIDSVREKYNDKCLLLIINYFGGADIHNEIKKIRSVSSTASIILDNAQALFSMFESFDVDFMFTSFRKQLPVPDGAWVISRNAELFQCEENNSFAQYKFAAGLLKNNKQFVSVSDQVYLDLFKKGDSLILSNINSKISDITTTILKSIDFDSIRQKRIDNSQYLIEGLHKIGISPIINFSNNVVPLFVPVFIHNRDHLRQKMRNHNIFIPVHWPQCEEVTSPDKRLYGEELSLIIDQRYSKNHMSKILSLIQANLDHEL